MNNNTDTGTMGPGTMSLGTINGHIEQLEVAKCKSLTVERVYTIGFTITAGQYDGMGPFTTVLHVTYLAGANKTISIVQYRTIGSDTCIRNAVLSSTGTVDIADYNVTDTHTIYAIINSVLVGSTTIQCCTSPIDYTNCPVSNCILFKVADIGNMQLLSNPSGAHIWSAPTGQIPTDSTKVTPDTISGLPIGNYDYILKLAHFNDYTGPAPIVVSKDMTTIVGPIDLIPSEGCIYFKSYPSGAKIYLAPTGQVLIDTILTTPNIICGKPLGDYIYKLTLSGYEDATGTITLGAGHGEIVNITMIGTPVLTSITISPLNPSVTINTEKQFNAIPIDQYGHPIGAIVTWSSSYTYAGTIDLNTGIFSALHTGTTVITAISEIINGTTETISSTTTVTVTPLVPVLSSITVFPTTTSIVAGNATIFTATKLDQLGNPISATVTWSSNNTAVGTISQDGVFIAISSGSSIITATSTSGLISGIAIANVTPAVPVESPVLTKIKISPSTMYLVVGNGAIFDVSTLDQFNDPISATVEWNSSDTNVGTIDQNGVFFALNEGISIISATSGTITGVALVNVSSGTDIGTGTKTTPSILGNVTTAAWILGTAIVGSVILGRQSKIPEAQIVYSKPGEEGTRAKIKRLQESK